MFEKFKSRFKGWLGKEETLEKQEPQVSEEKTKQKTEKPKKEKKKKQDTKKTDKKPEKEKSEKAKIKEPEQIKEPKEKEEEKPEQIKETKEILEQTPIKEPEIIQEQEIQEKTSIFSKFKNKFKKRISEQEFEEIFSELELILLENNVALKVVLKIKQELKENLVNQELTKNIEEEIKDKLKQAIESILEEPFDFIKEIKEKIKTQKPYVIVFFGINGTGKTTSIAKIANLLQKNNLSCVMSASDTFRAASIEQIKKHASKLNIKAIAGDYGSDPAAVAFDTIKYAKSHSIDVVLIDTAGRMHTEINLIREMEKIVRVSKPDLKIFVGESTTGNDIIEQITVFNEYVGIDNIILTKADIDEKGGSALSVSYTTKKPILFLGTGQLYQDLEQFKKDKIIKRMFE